MIHDSAAMGNTAVHDSPGSAGFGKDRRESWRIAHAQKDEMMGGLLEELHHGRANSLYGRWELKQAIEFS